MIITAEPRSDQWNASDFIGGPRTFTVAGVRPGTAEQKYDVLLEGEERVWRPPLTVLRILIAVWGEDSTVWPGRRVRLYRDASIRFGKDTPGGIRLSHVSHIEKTQHVSLPEKRGASKTHTVEPLLERDWLTELTQANGDLPTILTLGKAAQTAGAPAAVVARIRAEYQRVNGAAQQGGE